ncbi:MAG: hypothetical protein FJX76_15770 [Armatimonadetes bacterium]|nr:hypothetical protein [Armatimonadota bacterium]
MIQIHSGLKATMSNYLKTGSLGEGARPDRPFLGEFGTLMLATESVRPLFQADQVDGVDIASAPNQVEISPDALKNNPEYSGFSNCTRVRCEFTGPKDDPEEVTFHTQRKGREQVTMVKYDAKPDGSATIRYVSADARDNEVGWLIQGHEIQIKAGASPFEAECRSQVLLMNPTPRPTD